MPELGHRRERRAGSRIGGAGSSLSPELVVANILSQRFVLAEYIKASQVDTDQLVAFIKMYNLQADWFSMQLPGGKSKSVLHGARQLPRSSWRTPLLTQNLPGRNMHQCMRAASSMLDIDLDLPSMPNLKKRKSANDLLTDQAPKRVASMATPILYQPPSRPHAQTPPLPQPSPQLSQPGSIPRAVNIQPRPTPDVKPSTSEGYSVFQSKAPSNGYGVFQSNPTGRKRGRPSKAEKEAQARATSASHVSTGPIPISPKPAIQPSQGPPSASGPIVPITSGSPPGPTYSTYAAVASSDPRIPRAASVGRTSSLPRGLPQTYAEQSRSIAKSEKSPSIENLVTAEPVEEQSRSAPSPLVTPHTRDPPPVTNSA